MKRHLQLLLLMACLIVPWTMRAQETVTIGDGTTTSYVTPYNSLWGYSFVEQIYTADEIDMAGSITSIAFNLRESDAAQTNQIDVFMKNVDRESFTSTTDYEPVTASDMVFSGSVTFSPGWTTIELDTPFPYDGSSNLMIAIHEYTSGYSTRYFYYTSAPNMVITFHSDSANPDPYNLSSYSGNKYTSPNRANIKLEIAPLDGYCPKPNNFAARNVGTTTATIGWSIAEMFDNVSSVTVEYGEMGFTPGEGTTVTTTADSIDLTDLEPGTFYKAFAVSTCTEDGLSDTSWLTFKTYGLPIESLPYYTGFDEGDDVAWDTYNGVNGWYIDTVVNNTEGGSRGLYISNNNGADNAYTISTASYSYACRTIQLEAGSYALSFDWKAGGEADFDYIRAFLIPSATPPTANVLPDGQTATQAFSTHVTTDWVNMAGFFNLSTDGWQADSWQTAEVVGTVPTAGLYLLTIAWINDAATGTQPPAAIDNINFYQLSCAAPTDLVFDTTSITSDGFSFSWTPVGSENSWQVRIDNGEWETVSSTSYEASGLTSSSRHTVYVRAVCSADDISFSLVGSCRTLCGPIDQLPYTESFEDNAANSFPECWHPVLNRVSGSTTYPYVNSNFHNSGTRCLYAYPITTNPIFIASQPIDLPPDMIHVSFAARVGGTLATSKVQAGLMTSLTDTSSFIPLCTVTGTNNEWTEEGCEFYTDGVEIDADTIYVAFRFGAVNTTGVAECIDDIRIEEASDCRRPVNPVVLDYNYNSITYGWTDNSNASDGYVVRFGTTNNVNAESNIDYEAYENELSIEDLQPSTTYYAWVATSCGGELTAWRALPAVTTQQICYSVQNATVTNIGLTTAALIWNFSDGGIHATEVDITVTNQIDTDAEPIIINTTGTTAFLTDLTPGTAYKAVLYTHCDEYNAPDSVVINFSTATCGSQTGTTTTSYVPFYGLYKYGYSQALYPASMVAAIDTITGIQYELNASNATARVIDIYIGYTDMTSFTTTSYVPVSQLTQVVADRTISLADGGWVNIPFDNAYINNGGGSNLVIAVVNKTGSYSSFSWKGYTATAGSCVYWYRDASAYDLNDLPNANSASSTALPNIRFNGNCDVSGCMASNMLATDATTESIEVSWVPNGSEEFWIVRHRTPNGEWEYSEELTESPYIIEGLNPSSAYEVALGSLCGDEDTNYSSLVAYTDCAPVELPYYNDFSTALGPCWNTTTVTYNATGNIQFTAAGSQAILPEMPLNNVMVTLGLRSGAVGNKLKLGVTSNNGTTVQWLDTITSTSTTEYVPLSSTLNDYDGDATRLVLACGPSTTSLYIDYISVSEIPECMPVEGIASANVTGHTATISWDESSYSEFQFRYHIVGQPWIDSIISETTVELTDLEPLSNYQVQVRPICSGGDTTFWAQTSFTTPCGYYDSPFFEDFSATTIPSCWDRYTGVYSDHPTISSTTSGWILNTNNVMDGTRHIKMNIYGTAAKYWLVTPSIVVGENMSLSFDYALSQYNQTVAPTSTDGTADDRFIVALSTDNGSNWTKLAEWSCDTLNGAFNYLNIGLNDRASIDLAEYSDQVVRIAFYGESTVAGGDRDLHIDNVLISVTGCDRPDSVQVSDISFNSAVLSWVDNSSLMTGYEVRYGPYANVDNDSLTSVTIGTTSLTLEGLQPATVYHAWVRTLCGEGSTSPWNSFGNFRTPRSCYAPASYDISSIGYTAITFSWTVNADSAAAGRPITGTILRFVNLSDTNVADTVITVTDTNNTTVDGLYPNTDYRVYMTTECEPDSSNASYFNFSTQGCGTINPGGYNITGVPFHGTYKYGYSQTLYPASALMYMDTIRGISYYVSSVPSSNTTRTVNVYLANTDRVRLDTNSYMPVDSLSLMATNYAMDVSHTGWTTITFDTFFVWDGNSDILVAVQNVTGQYTAFNFRGHQVDSNKNAYWYRDPAIITPDNPNAPSGTTLPNRNSSNLVADIRFEGNCNLGTCLPPMLTIDSTTTTAAYITLTPGLEDDFWVVAYRQYGSETWLYDEASALEHRVINGLQHSTLYEFRGGSICDNDTMWGAILEEYTECAAVAVPIVETFDNSLSPCWGSNNLSYYYNSTGDLYYKLNNAESYIATPVIDAAIDTLQVRVSWYPTTANKMLRLGTVNANGEDLVWLDSAAVASTSTFTETIFFVVGYTGTTTNRRFVLANAVGTTASNITSIIVEPIMACPPIRNAVATSLSQNSAVVDWTDIVSAGSWSIEYGNSGFTPGNGTVVTVTSHPATINGLDAMTTYTFYITPNCAESGSNMTISASTMTAMCDDLTIAQNFADGATSTTTNYSPLGTSLWKYNYIQTIIDSADLAQIEGDINALAFLPASTNKGDYYTHIDVYMANVSDSILTDGFIMPNADHTFVQVITDADFCYTTTDWQIHGFDQSFTWDGHSNVLVAVRRSHGSWSSGNSFVAYTLPTNSKKVRYASQDSGPYDINTVTGGTATNTVGALRLYSCNGPSCHVPIIASTEVTETSVTINFNGDANNYEVVIMEGAWGEPTSGMIPVSSTSYTFSDLTPATQYTVGVRAICEDELTSDWVYQMVTTLELVCPAPTNVVVSDVTITTATVAWTVADETQSTWEVNITGLNYDQTFTATTNPYTITGLTAGVEYTVKVRAICGENEGEWSAAATFTTGICEPVSNVTVSNITDATATVAWTAPEGQTTWQLDYGAQGHPQGTGTMVVVNTNPYTINNLNEYTPYDVYVRAVCADGIYSEWSTKASFTTLEDSEGIDGVNSALISLYPNPATNSVTISGISGEAMVSVVDMNGRTVYTEKATETLTIDLTGYAQGAYFVRISGEQTMAIRKLIVK